MLRRDGMLVAIEKDGAAFGCGFGLAALMAIFIGVAICLFVKANRCLAVIVSETLGKYNLNIVWRVLDTSILAIFGNRCRVVGWQRYI